MSDRYSKVHVDFTYLGVCLRRRLIHQAPFQMLSAVANGANTLVYLNLRDELVQGR